MHVIGDAVAAKVNHVVALRQVLRISYRNRLPGFAAVHRAVVVTSVSSSRWAAICKRRRDDVLGILWIDGNRHFRRANGVRITNAKNLLTRYRLDAETNK